MVVSKEYLEVLNDLMGFIEERDNCFENKWINEDYELVKEALQRLEAIDNAKPSETLGKLRELRAKPLNWDTLIKVLDEVEQALIKAQEMEKVLNGIIKHLSFEDGGIEVVKDFINDKEENKYIIKVISKDTGATIHIHLDTQEEFDTLKEWVDE